MCATHRYPINNRNIWKQLISRKKTVNQQLPARKKKHSTRIFLDEICFSFTIHVEMMLMEDASCVSDCCGNFTWPWVCSYADCNFYQPREWLLTILKTCIVVHGAIIVNWFRAPWDPGVKMTSKSWKQQVMKLKWQTLQNRSNKTREKHTEGENQYCHLAANRGTSACQTSSSHHAL